MEKAQSYILISPVEFHTMVETFSKHFRTRRWYEFWRKEPVAIHPHDTLVLNFQRYSLTIEMGHYTPGDPDDQEDRIVLKRPFLKGGEPMFKM